MKSKKPERYVYPALFTYYGKDKEIAVVFPDLDCATSGIDDTDALLEAILEIYKKYVIDLPIRNISISFGDLSPASHQQLNIFEDEEEQYQRRNLQKALDLLHSKYGKNSVLRASALLEESTVKERNECICHQSVWQMRQNPSIGQLLFLPGLMQRL